MVKACSRFKWRRSGFIFCQLTNIQLRLIFEQGRIGNGILYYSPTESQTVLHRLQTSRKQRYALRCAITGGKASISKIYLGCQLMLTALWNSPPRYFAIFQEVWLMYCILRKHFSIYGGKIDFLYNLYIFRRKAYLAKFAPYILRKIPPYFLRKTTPYLYGENPDRRFVRCKLTCQCVRMLRIVFKFFSIILYKFNGKMELAATITDRV